MLRSLFTALPLPSLRFLVVYAVAAGACWFFLPPDLRAWVFGHQLSLVGVPIVALLGVVTVVRKPAPCTSARDVSDVDDDESEVERLHGIERDLCANGLAQLGVFHLYAADTLDRVLPFYVHPGVPAFAEPVELREGPHVCMSTVLEDGYVVTTAWENPVLVAVSEEGRERRVVPRGPIADLVASHRVRLAEIVAARGVGPATHDLALALGRERHALSQFERHARWETLLGVLPTLTVLGGVIVGIDLLDGWAAAGAVVAGGVALFGIVRALASADRRLHRAAKPGRVPAEELRALGRLSA